MAGPQPILLSEYLSYFEIFKVREVQTRERYLRVLQGMDEVFLCHFAELAMKDSEAPKAPRQ